LQSSQSAEINVIFLIADISGYTRFIVSNEKEMAHSQIIIRDLINTILEEIKSPMQLIRLEGDALFLYIDKDDPLVRWELVKATLLERLIDFFRLPRIFQQNFRTHPAQDLQLQCLQQCREVKTQNCGTQR